MTDHEALEALSKKATQGMIEALMPETEHDHGVPLIATDYPGTFGPSNGLVLWATMLPTEITDEDTAQAEANAAFTAALWNTYRTGQLIPAPSVDDAMVERVARAIYKADTEDQNHSTRPQLDLSSIDLDQWYDENAAMTLSGPGFVQRHRTLATAAISAMQVKP